jgi:hypothetical protein
MQSRRLQVVLAVLAAALTVVLVVMLLGGGDDQVSLTPGEPQIVSSSELEGFADGADHAVYWVGEIENTEYELTETDNGRVFVRYVPSGTDAGARGEYLTVASYPLEDAPSALEKTARRQGDEIASSDDGAVILLDTESPNNIHMAYPGNVQIEVFSPVAGEALRLSKDSVQQVP